MKITILTIFPEMFTPLHESILGRAQKAGLLEIREVDIRSYSKNKHHNTDDAPYGGGAGMVMLASRLWMPSATYRANTFPASAFTFHRAAKR